MREHEASTERHPYSLQSSTKRRSLSRMSTHMNNSELYFFLTDSGMIFILYVLYTHNAWRFFCKTARSGAELITEAIAEPGCSRIEIPLAVG